jgi:hypothetical protein
MILSRGPGFTAQEKRLPRYLYVEQHLELKEVVTALHTIGEALGLEKWKEIVYDTVRRWAVDGKWEQERQLAAGIDLSGPVPSYWHIDDTILHRRLALSKKLQEEAMTGKTARARALATKLYRDIERDLDQQNTRREFFANREPVVIMETIVAVARQLTGTPVNRDEIMACFDREYKTIAARRGLRLLPKGAVS